MSRRCGSGAALFFTAMVLAGCSLVESVIVVEPAKEAPKPARLVTRTASLAPDEGRCGPKCLGAQNISRSYSAKYDSGPVLKPIKRTPQPKPEEPDSIFIKTVKSFLRTGLQLHSWMTRE